MKIRDIYTKKDRLLLSQIGVDPEWDIYTYNEAEQVHFSIKQKLNHLPASAEKLNTSLILLLVKLEVFMQENEETLMSK